MLSPLQYLICILFAASATVLLHYGIQFIKFAKADNEAKRILKLNKTVDNILKYKERENDPIIIDVTDYQVVNDEGNVIDLSEDLPYELSKLRLVYRKDLNAWIKVKTESF